MLLAFLRRALGIECLFEKTSLNKLFANAGNNLMKCQLMTIDSLSDEPIAFEHFPVGVYEELASLFRRRKFVPAVGAEFFEFDHPW